MNNGYMQYKEQTIYTSTPGELIILLYNAAIKNLNIAVANIEAKDLYSAHKNLIKAQDIINELLLSLEMKFPLAEQLNSLYLFIHSKLVEANIKKDVEIISEIIPLLTELRDSWQQAERMVRINNSNRLDASL